MSIREWFHHLLNPHCPVCAEREQANRICASCEYLKIQVEKLQILNKELIDKIALPDEKTEYKQPEQTVPVTPKFIPWRVRQQQLEAESRRAAEVMRNKQTELKQAEPTAKIAPADDPDVIELEKEMGIVEAERLVTKSGV